MKKPAAMAAIPTEMPVIQEKRGCPRASTITGVMATTRITTRSHPRTFDLRSTPRGYPAALPPALFADAPDRGGCVDRDERGLAVPSPEVALEPREPGPLVLGQAQELEADRRPFAARVAVLDDAEHDEGLPQLDEEDPGIELAPGLERAVRHEAHPVRGELGQACLREAALARVLDAEHPGFLREARMATPIPGVPFALFRFHVPFPSGFPVEPYPSPEERQVSPNRLPERAVPRGVGRWTILLLAACAAGDGPPSSDPRLAFATRDATGFERLGPPAPGDWRERFKERRQTFDAYVGCDPVRAAAGDVLAFLPVGPFSEKERLVLDRATELAAIWFDLPVRALAPAELPAKGWHRDKPWGRQYETAWFLRRLLPERRPPEAICTFAVTMADLYPDDSWNYVFGEASLVDRVGVWSYARYFPAFWGQEETADSRTQALRRGLKVVVHEMGHAFGIEHCQWYACVMNGSNSLEEMDRQPLRLCPPCLRKLQWNRGFDVVTWHERLRDFYRASGLLPEAEWIEKRLHAIGAAR